MSPVEHHDDERTALRAGARRTALVVAGIAVLVYIGFILTGVLAS